MRTWSSLTLRAAAEAHRRADDRRLARVALRARVRQQVDDAADRLARGRVQVGGAAGRAEAAVEAGAAVVLAALLVQPAHERRRTRRGHRRQALARLHREHVHEGALVGHAAALVAAAAAHAALVERVVAARVARGARAGRVRVAHARRVRVRVDEHQLAGQAGCRLRCEQYNRIPAALQKFWHCASVAKLLPPASQPWKENCVHWRLTRLK